MEKYDKWNGLQGLRGKVTLNHLLFGGQIYECDELHVVNDNEKIGIVIKGKELFVYKQKVIKFYINGNTYEIEDDMLNIKVVVNKL